MRENLADNDWLGNSLIDLLYCGHGLVLAGFIVKYLRCNVLNCNHISGRSAVVAGASVVGSEDVARAVVEGLRVG